MTSWHQCEAKATMADLQPTGDCRQSQPDTQTVARVISVRGSQVTLGLRRTAPNDPDAQRVTVGNFIGIRVGQSLLIGMITNVSLQTHAVAREEFAVAADLDVLGE